MPTPMTLTTMTGIHQEADAAEIPDNACTACANVVFDKGTIRTRPGRARHSAVPDDALTARIRGLFQYANGNDTPQVRLLATIGDRVYATHAADQRFTSFLRLNTAVSTAHPVRFAQFNECVYFVDGAGNVKQADCTRVTEGLIDVAEIVTPYSPTTAPGLAQRYAQYRLIDCRAGDPDGVGYGFYDPDAGPPVPQVTFPASLCAYSVQANDDVNGATVRGMTDPAHVYSGQTASLALEIFNGAGGGAITGGVRFYRILPEALDLSLATRITLRYQAKAGGGDAFPDGLSACISEDGVTWTEYAIDTGGQVKDTWYTTTIDISGTAAVDRDAVRYVGVKCQGIETEGAARLEQTATMYRPAETSAWTLLLDAVETDITQPVFAEGEYQVTYTYVDADSGEESRPYRTGEPAAPYPAFILNSADCIGLSITATLDENANASAINFYARGGTSASFLRVGSLAVTDPPEAGEPYAVVWDGQYPAAAPALLDEYSVAPPAGCSLLFADKGRMIYVGENPAASSGFHDTVFVSNLEKPGRVILQALADMSTVHGFYQAVGQDGAAVTGIGALAGNVVLFKARGAYLFSGTDSNSFRLDLLSSEHGCVSHESIQPVEGGFLAWLDHDRIWAWDGRQFTDLGEPITPILATYTAAQKAAAFSVYDPARRLLIFTIPATGAPSPTPAADSLVFDLKDGSWTRWTQQPGGCACYAALAQIPGVYAGDPYGADGAGHLYRLNTGTADATSTSDEEPIAWSWYSKHFAHPYPGHEKDVQEVIVDLGPHGDGESLTLSVRPEGDASAQETAAVPIIDTPGNRGRCSWWPAAQLGGATVQLGIAGSTAEGCEVRGITWTAAKGARAR
ncbi:MAG: hypothetical protein ACYC7E_18840 [Armatimonadota bacterium]